MARVCRRSIKGQLEDEFKKDGIKVQWTFARGAGTAVNEQFANDLADISLLGDLPSIIARSSGVKTKVLAAAGVSNLYIAVPADSPSWCDPTLLEQVLKEENLVGYWPDRPVK